MESFWNTGILLVGILHICVGQSINCSSGLISPIFTLDRVHPAICDITCPTFPDPNTPLTCLCYHNSTDFELAPAPTAFPGLLSLLTSVLFLIYFPIIIFFNINLASGPNHSFVFFYQCVTLLTPVGRITGLLVLQNLLYTYDEVLTFALNIYFTQPGQPLLVARGFNAGFTIFEYCKYVAVFPATLLIVFLVWCTWCPLQKCRLPWAKTRRAMRNFREKHIGRTFIHGICSIIILGFGDLVATSMVMLGESSIVIIHSSCCYNYDLPSTPPESCSDPAIALIRNGLLRYLLPSFIVLLLLLPLPLSLIYYPTIPALFHKLTKRSLPRFPKLDPVFDVFQGVYKDKMRWFAGVHLLYRVLLWAIYFSADRVPNTRNSILLGYFVFVLTIHCLFQPFKKPRHNYLETLYLLNLISILISNALWLNLLSDTPLLSQRLSIALSTFTIPTLLVLLPFTVLLCVCCYKYCCKRLCCRRCVQQHPPISPEEQELDDTKVEGDTEDSTEDIPYYVADWSV